jgi:hypothetical protein
MSANISFQTRTNMNTIINLIIKSLKKLLGQIAFLKMKIDVLSKAEFHYEFITTGHFQIQDRFITYLNQFNDSLKEVLNQLRIENNDSMSILFNLYDKST